MTDSNLTTNYQKDDGFGVGNLQIAAYMFAGLAMMLNIRLSYSAAPYALLRFKLPENLFSVFVRTTSSALELWCIPSMLIGNIMEQVYIKTQDTAIEIHAANLKNSDLQTKTGTLKTTATDQSTSELGSTYQTDLNTNGNAQDGLKNKATTLAQKADLLHTAAESLESAAIVGSPLATLKSQAGALKTAAGTTGSGDNSLYKKAEELAKRGTDEAADQATKVIGAFDKVETKYNLLMGAYKKILDDPAKAAKLTDGDNDKVTNVVKTYHEVKTIYYQMLITYRIQQKAKEFHNAADTLKKAAKAEPSANPLKKLQEAASGEMDALESAASTLKDITVGAEQDSNIVEKYLKVEKDYYALATKPEFTDALKAEESKNTVEPVTTAFEALQKSYENVLKLRVQELSTRAQALSGAASSLAGVGELGLTKEATQLADAAMGTSDGLKQKAELLVTAINSKDGDTEGTNASTVITQFNTVRTRYNDLANKDKYQDLLKRAEQEGTSEGDEEKVKNVEDAYNNLKDLYNSIIKFTKIKHYSSELNNAVQELSHDPKKVIINFNAAVTVYKLLDDTKSIVESQFTALQTEYSNAIYVYKKYFLAWPSIATNWLNFLTFVILFIIYVTGGDQGNVTGYYWIMAISGFVFGINMVLVYAVDYRYLAFYMAGENSFPMVTSMILYFATSIFGNRRKYNSDYLVVLIDISIAILIAFVASVLWTVAFHKYRTPLDSGGNPNWPALISPIAMVIVGMGLVYTIYPGIAPGMIVPFYLIDKIEMVLLVATAFPPVIIAILRQYAKNWSPQTDFLLYPESGFKFGGWEQYNANEGWPPQKGAPVYAWIWHFFDVLMPLQISLAVIFIYSLHYRESSIARSIINQPKMSTFLTIMFYMCHEILLALGFPGMVGNGGAGGQVMLPVQYVGALLMVFLAFYSIGYITEYKKHDPSQWPTEGMTKWNALCYWLKMASKITNKNFKQLFTTDLRRDLLLCIQKNELI